MKEHVQEFNADRLELEKRILTNQSTVWSINNQLEHPELCGSNLYKLYDVKDNCLDEIAEVVKIIINMDIVEIMVWANDTLASSTPK